MAAMLMAGCSSTEKATAPATGGSPVNGKRVQVTIGYQSKTINTVTAGTLLRELGIFERRLSEIGKTNGNTYSVTWEDYPSGPPITAQMLAGKVDIGSMGDYPLLVNGSKTKDQADARSELLAITGYNLRGSLNGIVVPLDSKAKSLNDLKGQTVSTSIGSAGHGMVAKALSDIGQSTEFVKLVNQQPEVGISALEGGQAAALAQFVPWPDLEIFRGKARKLYDGGDTGVPTMHGVIGRKAFSEANPEVTEAFLASVMEASDFIHAKPFEAAERVSKATGIEPEVVYLFNGPNGLVTFDPTIKPRLIEALRQDLPFLKSLNALADFDVDQFVNDSYLRKVYGPTFEADSGGFENKTKLSGHDSTCSVEVSDVMTASEAWFDGQAAPQPSATPTCLVRAAQAKQESGGRLRVAYVPDARTGTRLFAKSAAWVRDPGAPAPSQLLPFATAQGADGYVAAHPGSQAMSFDDVLRVVLPGI